MKNRLKNNAPINVLDVQLHANSVDMVINVW